MGSPHGTQLILATCFTKVSIGLLGLLWTALLVPRGLPTLDPAHCGHVFHKKFQLGLPVCGLNVDPFWIHVCCPPFWVSFRWPELGNNWVLCRLLCGSHMGCPRGTQLMLAKCFTKVPIGLAHVLRVRCPCCHQRANQGSPIGTSTHCQLKKRNMHCRSSQLSYIVECHIACIATSHTHTPITQ